MKLSTRVKTILLGAVAATLPLPAHDAHAQYRVGEDGRLLDANNRIGSGGYNTGGIPYTALTQGNRIVTGNVTAGREFRAPNVGVGGLPLNTTQSVYTDPLELRAPIAAPQTDAFIRRSYGVTNAAAGQLINQPYVFYGRALATPPPAGAVQQGFTGTYVVPQAPPYTVTSPFIPQINNQITSPQVTLPRPGELLLPGPVDAQTNLPTYLRASPLGGVRQLRAEDLQSDGLLYPTNPMFRTRQNDNDPLRLETNTIRGMQLELRRAAGLRDTEDEQTDDRTRSGNTLPGTGNLARPIDRPIDTAETPSLNQRPLDNSIAAISNPEVVRPGMRNRLNVPVPPARQSSQLARMERQLDQYYGQRLATAEQENQEFLKQLRARQAAADKLAQQGDPANPNDPNDPAVAVPGDTARPNYREMSRRILEMSREKGTVGDANANDTTRQSSAIQESIRRLEQRPPGETETGAPGAGTPGGAGTAPRQGGDAAVVRPQPMQVASLVDGIKAEGLAKVMRQAEALMKEGKYVSALEQYVLAEEVAPNNPLVWLGQAHAELGAGYYLRAADHLRRALAAEPALMMAQYDLRGMIGQDRLETLVRDLKETAKAQEKEHGLVFLLSYLAYNTSNVQQAAIYLDLAQKRAGGNDEIYRLVRLHWNLPGGDGAIIEEPRIPLSEVYKQFEQGNVASATVTDTAITARLKAPTELPGLTEPVRSFRATLPPGAAAGAFGTWLKNNSNGATVRFETTAPAATEANK